jgi:Spy/CpxP family protein refolding chaperone
MIKQLSLLLPGAIAFTLSIAPVLPAFSQTTPTPTAPQIQNHRNKLNLTDDQKAKFKQIRESTRAQIEAVLTDDQKAKLQSLKEQRQAMRQQRQAARQQGQSTKQPGQRGKGMWSTLNLTDDQKAKIREIRQASRKQMEAVLTAEQLQQFQQMRQQRQQRHQQTQPNT